MGLVGWTSRLIGGLTCWFVLLLIFVCFVCVVVCLCFVCSWVGCFVVDYLFWRLLFCLLFVC